MKVFLKRDTGEADSRFEVSDEKGIPKYTVRGRHTPSGEHIRIRDCRDAVVCKIRRLGFNAFSAYSVRADNVSIRLNVVLSGGMAVVRFRGISFCVRGDVIAGNYDILDADGSVVCAVCKDFAKQCITLTVNMDERELLCIAAAVCIDSLSIDAVPALQMI